MMSQIWSIFFCSSFDSVPMKPIFFKISRYWEKEILDSGFPPTPTSSERSSKSLKNFLMSILEEVFWALRSIVCWEFESIDDFRTLLFHLSNKSFESQVELDLFVFHLNVYFYCQKDCRSFSSSSLLLF